jgi:NAD(P)H-hydrate epimerase
MSPRANFVYPPDIVRAFDQTAIRDYGIPGYGLMCRAGTATLAAARQRWPAATRWLVLCGAGNNAGDGYVIARLAREAGLAVAVLTLADPASLAGDAAQAYAGFVAAGGAASPWTGSLPAADLVVDALLGTGLARPVAGPWRAVIEQLNAQQAPVVAVDIPTGLDAGSGAVLGAAVEAQLTVTFVALKAGLFLAAGPDHCGEVLLADLDVPEPVYAGAPPVLRRFGLADLRARLPARRASAHKGLFGHVLVVGGNAGFGGAVRLAGEAALRAGAGLVTVATRPANAPFVTAARPELMTLAVQAPADLDALLARATVLAIGPGLGQDDWARALFDRVLATDRPLVVDADALNLLAGLGRRRDDWVLTPHPGEAARLLASTTADVQSDRLGAVRALADRYGGTVVLKGRGTLVAGGTGVPWLIDRGNPGMATAGMGDVLTGITAGLLAQVPGNPRDMAAAAAFVHGAAGDQVAAAAPRGLLAGDLLAALRSWVNPAGVP